LVNNLVKIDARESAEMDIPRLYLFSYTSSWRSASQVPCYVVVRTCIYQIRGSIFRFSFQNKKEKKTLWLRGANFCSLRAIFIGP
jgi:hypothetical protein